jgi:hypothetical protein
MKIRPVEAELFHGDRQADTTKMEIKSSSETVGNIVQNFWCPRRQLGFST